MQKVTPPLSFLKCEECGTENSRPYAQNDYVFRHVEEKCPKCGNTKMTIINIYVQDKKPVQVRTSKPSVKTSIVCSA